MILDYVKERYNPTDFEESLDSIAERFERDYRSKGVITAKTEAGFITFQIKGDALIVWDIFVKPEYRDKAKASAAWKLHNIAKSIGEKWGMRVMIGFSEKNGKNKEAGVKAMKTAGFMKAYDTDLSTVYIKGI